MVKSDLDSSCKRFRITAIGKKFKLKPGPQMKKTLPDKRGNYIHQYREVKEMLYPISFLYVLTTFEHRVQDLFLTQKVQIFSSFRKPETLFRHDQGQQRAGTLKGSINSIQNTTITEIGVEHQKLGKLTNWLLFPQKRAFTSWRRKETSNVFHCFRYEKITAKFLCQLSFLFVTFWLASWIVEISIFFV